MLSLFFSPTSSFPVAVTQHLYFKPYSLGRTSYSNAANFKDANAFSVSLAKQEYFSCGNFPLKKIITTTKARAIFHLLESEIDLEPCLRKRGGKEKRNAIECLYKTPSLPRGAARAGPGCSEIALCYWSERTRSQPASLISTRGRAASRETLWRERGWGALPGNAAIGGQVNEVERNPKAFIRRVQITAKSSPLSDPPSRSG